MSKPISPLVAIKRYMALHDQISPGGQDVKVGELKEFTSACTTEQKIEYGKEAVELLNAHPDGGGPFELDTSKLITK